MKRFLLFVLSLHCVEGGWDDLFESYSTFEEADEIGVARLLQGAACYQVVDITTGNVSKGYR